MSRVYYLQVASVMMPWIVAWQLSNSAASSRELGRTGWLFAFADVRWSTLLLLFASSSLLAGASLAMWYKTFAGPARLGVVFALGFGLSIPILKAGSTWMSRQLERKS